MADANAAWLEQGAEERGVQRSAIADAANAHHIQPPAQGQKRERQDWENLWMYGMFGGMLFGGVLVYYKPDTTYVPAAGAGPGKGNACCVAVH